MGFQLITYCFFLSGFLVCWQDYIPPFELNPVEFWTTNLIVYRCLKRTLKVVEVKCFQGTRNEIHFLQYLLFFGRILEEVNLYLSEEDDGYGGTREKYLLIAQYMQQHMKRTSGNLRISIFYRKGYSLMIWSTIQLRLV